MGNSSRDGQSRFMRHPVLSTMAMFIMTMVPLWALCALLGAPWWWTLGFTVLAAVLGSYASYRTYRNPKDPGPLVRFLADPVGWFTDSD